MEIPQKSFFFNVLVLLGRRGGFDLGGKEQCFRSHDSVGIKSQLPSNFPGINCVPDLWRHPDRSLGVSCHVGIIFVENLYRYLRVYRFEYPGMQSFGETCLVVGQESPPPRIPYGHKIIAFEFLATFYGSIPDIFSG
jgi:hypothetical protein